MNFPCEQSIFKYFGNKIKSLRIINFQISFKNANPKLIRGNTQVASLFMMHIYKVTLDGINKRECSVLFLLI